MTERVDQSLPAETLETVFDVLSSVRAMRKLSPDPVPDDVLEQLVRAASWAPSGSNAQAYHFVVVTDRDQIRRIAALWQEVVDWYLAIVGDAKPASMDAAAYQRILAANRYQSDHFADTPAIIVPCYDTKAGKDRMRAAGLSTILRATWRFGLRRTMRNTRLAGDINNAASIYPAVQNLLIAARSLGLGATLTIAHLGAEEELKEILGIPRHVRTYAIVPVGWPLGRLGKVSRPAAATLMHRDRWNGRWA
jgi:nitroreductase